MLNWATDFFEKDGAKGKNIRLSRDHESMVIGNTPATTYLFSDWFDGAEKPNKA